MQEVEEVKREFCPRCAIKHLAQARALMLETRKGYPLHVWYAMGHMAEAEDEIVEFMPEQAELIRVERKKIEESAGGAWYNPDWGTLMLGIGEEAMLEETQCGKE